MKTLRFVRSRLARDRTSTGIIVALAALVTAGVAGAVAALADSDASSFVNPFLVPLLLGVLLSVATADSLGRPRVAEELERLGWTSRERVVAFALERTAAIAIGVVPVALAAAILRLSGSVAVAVWMLVGALVTSIVGETGRARRRSAASAQDSSLWRVLGAGALCLFGLAAAVTLSTGVTNGSGMAFAVPAAIVMATVAGAAILPFVVGNLPSNGWARAALRPLRRDRRRVRAALVVILPCMMLMMLMSVFQPSFAARESERLAAREASVAEQQGSVRANELWVTTGLPAFNRLMADVSGELPVVPTPEARAAAIASASDALATALPDATVVEIDAFEAASGSGMSAWHLRLPAGSLPPGSSTEDGLDLVRTLGHYSGGLDVLVATPELLAALDPSGALSVPDGGALVFDEGIISDGVVTLSLSPGGEVVTWPAEVATGRTDGPVPVVIVSPEAVAGLDVAAQPLGLFVAAPDPIPEGVATVVATAGNVEVDGSVAWVEVHDAWSWFDGTGGVFATPQDELPFVPADLADVWRLLIVGSLIALAAIAAVVVGSMLDRGEDYEVLHRAGASQALRRTIAALQAGTVLLVAALFALGCVVVCTAVGFADYNALDETALPVPWHIDAWIAAVVVVGVPLVGALLAAAVAPLRSRSGGVVGGRPRPVRAHA